MSCYISALPVQVSVIAPADLLPAQRPEGKSLLLVCIPQRLVCQLSESEL
jgi:hypothetical protein